MPAAGHVGPVAKTPEEHRLTILHMRDEVDPRYTLCGQMWHHRTLSDDCRPCRRCSYVHFIRRRPTFDTAASARHARFGVEAKITESATDCLCTTCLFHREKESA